MKRTLSEIVLESLKKRKVLESQNFSASNMKVFSGFDAEWKKFVSVLKKVEKEGADYQILITEAQQLLNSLGRLEDLLKYCITDYNKSNK